MKRVGFAILLAAAAAGIFFAVTAERRSTADPSVYLPEQVLFSISAKNMAANAEEMKNQPLGRAVEQIDLVRLALDVDIDLEKVELLRRLRDFFSTPKANQMFVELCSKKITLALLDGDGGDGLSAHLHDNLLFFAEPEHNPLLIENLTQLFAGDTGLTTSQYGSHRIYRVPAFSDLTISFTLDDNLLIAAMEERTLRRALDRKDEHQVNLRENFFYALFSKRFGDSEIFCYFSIQNLRRFLENRLDRTRVMQGQILEHLNNLQGFTAGAYGAAMKEGYVKDTVIFHFNPYRLNSGTARFLAIPPQKNIHIENIPANASLYYWTNTFDPPTMWKMYGSESDMDATTIADIEAAAAAMAGISFEELLQIVDTTCHVIVGKPSPQDFVPLPNFTIMFHLRDVAKASLVMTSLLENARIPHRNDVYRNIPFTYWGHGVQDGLQPVYTIHDDSLYISSSVDMHRQMINAVIDGGSMIADGTLKKGSATLFQENNSIVYVRMHPLLTTLEDVVNWLQTMLSIQNRSTAYKSRKVIENLILPLLDGLKMYSTLATRSYTEEGKIVIELYRTRTNQNE